MGVKRKRTPLLGLILIGTVLAVNLHIRAHMNEKDSPRAGVIVTVDLANCLAKARDAADAQLNAAYEQLRGKLDSKDGQRLVAAQPASGRELCGGAPLLQVGMAASPAYLACMEATTRARTKELAITMLWC